jgi:hypothetical protein
MSEVLLLNPAKRRKARRNPSAAQRANRARFAAAARARSNPARRRKARRRNPAAAVFMPGPNRYASGSARGTAYRHRAASSRARSAGKRRANPARRRRNPISLGGVNVNSIMAQLKEGAIMGAGAVAADIGYGYIQRYLPASLQAGPGQVTAGSAIKAVITAAAGVMLSKSTRGLSRKAAMGALVVQARDIVAGLLPAGTVAGLGYSTPATRLSLQSNRIGPNRAAPLGAYTTGPTPLLSAYMAPGGSPLLSGGARARERAIR